MNSRIVFAILFFAFLSLKSSSKVRIPPLKSHLSFQQYYHEQTCLYDPMVIILVHGLLDSSNTFKDWSKYIYEDMNKLGLHPIVLGVDTPGHGHSPRQVSLDYISSAYKLEETIIDVKNNLTDTKVDIHLVGHSTGGKLCATLALQAPDLIKSVTFLDVMPVRFPESYWAPIRESINKIKDIPIETLNSAEEVHKYLSSVRMSVKLRKLLSLSTHTRTSLDTGQQQPNSGSGRDWNFDIKCIVSSLSAIQGFPDKNSLRAEQFTGKTLLVRADPKKSQYVRNEVLASLCYDSHYSANTHLMQMQY